MVEIYGALNERHHPQVLELVNGAGGVGTNPAFTWPPETLESELKAARGWGFWLDDDLQAFVLWREVGPDAEITVLATHPAAQGRGYMKNLLSQVFNAYRYKRWLLEVHEGNEAARKLYENMEFCEVGRRPRYYRDGAAALLLQRDGPG